MSRRMTASRPAAGSFRRTAAVTAAPALFVLLWSTGFVGAKYGLPYAPPFTFLALRLTIASTLLGVVAALSRSVMSREQVARAAVSGLLLHATYLGGVFWAISNGTPAGVSSVVVSLQPLLVAGLATRVLGERLVRRQWLGMVLGVAGVALVIAPGLVGRSAHLPVAGLIACVVALLGGTAGTLWQKRHGDGIPLLLGAAVQYAAAAVALLILARVTESMHVTWTVKFVGALLWLVGILSIGAVLLLLALLRRGSASRVSSLFYLVPPATAVEAFLVFGERLAALSVVGIAVTALGVALVVTVSPASIAPPGAPGGGAT